MKHLQNPEKELRFTRAAQAVPIWLLVAMLGGSSIILFACCLYRSINPELPHPLWALAPLVPAWPLARLAYRMTRHAYLILTPLGVEIFPLIRPERNMRVVYWGEIAEVENRASQSQLTLHFAGEQGGGIHLSLRPIPKAQRELLIHTLRERVGGSARK